MNEVETPILFYDGECRFCSASVDFILAKELNPELKFCWLQSPRAAKLLGEEFISINKMETMVLRADGITSLRSDAALKVCGYLRKPYSYATALHWIPKFLRDALYKLISAFRKKIMGSTTCALPIGHEERFLV